MKPLTLLADDDEDSNSSKEKNERDCAEAGVKENVESKPAILITGNDSKGKEKENSRSKPPCLDQLREELSCAVCLDICFEPSTISCGHSFCGTCLRSVLQNCGPRCPKCRQSLRSEALRTCKINTVLWNTIQILFPEESAARSQDQQRQRDEVASQKTLKDESRSRSLGTRPARLQPWRRSNLSEVTRTVNFGENLRSFVQTAVDLMSSSERSEAGAGRQESPSARITRVGIERRRIERIERQTQEASRHAPSRTRRQVRATQEEIDAALAARLQQAELNPESDVEEVISVEGSSRRGASHSHRRSSHDTSAFSSAPM